MNIKIFMATANSYLEREILNHFKIGIEYWVNKQNGQAPTECVRIGRWDTDNTNQHRVEYEYAESYIPCDVAVMFGSWKPREKGHHLVRSSIALNSNCFVCVETPLLNRSTKEINTNWRIGVNGFLNQSANWPEVNVGIANDRLSRLGVNWDGWRNNQDGHIVVALQLPGDASLRGTDINDWAYNVIKQIRSVSNRPITIRNHPLASQRAFGDHEELARKLLLDGIQGLRFSDGAIVPWAEDLRDAYCTVTFTTGLAIDSVLAGIPTVACDNGNFAWDLSTNFVKDIENIRKAEDHLITQWLHQLAMCQHTVDEMHSGQAWQLLIEPIKRAIESKQGKKK